jgi:transcriptional regulator with XRE-family HTH domain
MNQIGKKISESRKLKGLTQEELAEFAKMNLRTIQRIENSENIPRGKTLHTLCEVLELNIADFEVNAVQTKKIYYLKNLFDIFFLIIFNVILISIIGFLTLDSGANLNSRFGGYLLSFFIPLFIVYKTFEMNPLERILKFGTGYFLYGVISIIVVSFPIVFVTGLLPCLLISLGTLYYGKIIIYNEK